MYLIITFFFSPVSFFFQGKIVLVRRGNCPFVKKVESAQNAGAATVIVGGMAPYLVRMGVEPRWKGLSTAIPVVMVSSRAYGILVGETYAGAKLSFHEDLAVNATYWEELEKYHSGEGWPRSDTYIAKKYEELVAQVAPWPDRQMTVEEAYKKVQEKVTKTASSDSATSSDKSEL